MEYGRLVVLGYSRYEIAPPPADVSASASASTVRPLPGVLAKRAMEQVWEPIGGQNEQYVLRQRKVGNGVTLRRFHHVTRAAAAATDGRVDYEAHVLQRCGASTPERRDSFWMCVPMNDVDAHASVTEYALDASLDMFQIGRSPRPPNDVVVPGPRVGSSGTISRYAARIVCSREPPFEFRLFASGFDNQRRMITAGHAWKRCRGCGDWFKRLAGPHDCLDALLLATAASTSSNQLDNDEHHGGAQDKQQQQQPQATDDEEGRHVQTELTDASLVPIDGLTKNGVRVWLPEQRKWFEVSVNGNLYEILLRSPSSDATRAGSVAGARHTAFNRPKNGCVEIPALLTDGAIIDLGGVQLLFQSKLTQSQTPGDESLLRASMALFSNDAWSPRGDSSRGSQSIVAQLERMNVQCPVQLHALRFRRNRHDEVQFDQVPHVFPSCGHVFGFDARLADTRLCPLCRTPGHLVPLLLKENFQLLSPAERTTIPECVLNPCGHAISKKLATQFAALLMPNGRSICPFCAVHLDRSTPYSRLYLYSDDA
ncbi:hypothetical protein PINS_up002662 [Pythium insidiosum]|nr:hypothetical protein PINS_up002662 [Pythium insidiosum]